MRSPARIAVRAAVLDVAAVLVFVVIGRANHGHGETVAGVASTAWPFLAGLAVGWLAARAWRRPAGLWPSGVAAWLGTVAVGMALRVLAGQGTAWAFIVVALVFLGLFLLGWRLLARFLPAFQGSRGSRASRVSRGSRVSRVSRPKETS